MRIKNLTLKNFRNYVQETFEFDGGLNVLFGKNGQGKTNCAEAVFYLCTGTSPRASRDKQLIKHGELQAEISAEAEGRYGSLLITAQIRENGREVRVNGTKIARNADLLGNINSVYFSPSELRLIQDGPDERRRFLNISISQLSKSYYTSLIRYNKILEQRNNLLKDKDSSLVMETLPVWDEQLCRYAAVVIKKRTEFCERLSPLAKKEHATLTDGAEELEVYPDKIYGGTEEEIEQKLYKELKRGYERDLRLGFTCTGPHRDDLNIIINGADAKHYASQGQTRTAALSVKLAEMEIFKEYSGEYPILILDDVMSELDLPRRKKLAARAQGMQTILTCTHAERVLYGRQANKIRIEGGVIKR
ncbi:MAG: DNA replication/repair protein RecF [Clostridia bacterium]|nr:DNA replication/repair protein RecF [Clostridia bacterium]